MKKLESERVTSRVVACSECAICGNPGRYMSIENGLKAVSDPRMKMRKKCLCLVTGDRHPPLAQPSMIVPAGALKSKVAIPQLSHSLVALQASPHFRGGGGVNGMIALTVVPVPGVEAMARLPPIISSRSLMPTKPRRLGFLVRRSFATSN